MPKKIILVGEIKLPFRIRINLQNLPSASSPESGSSDDSGGRNEQQNTLTVRNPQGPQNGKWQFKRLYCNTKVIINNV